jgi:integrase
MAYKLPSYLHQNRHGIFGFRIVVPRALRASFPQAEYRITLHTAHRATAKRLAYGLAGFIHVYFERARMSRKPQEQNESDRSFVEDLEAERDRLGEALFSQLREAVLVGNREARFHDEVERLRAERERLTQVLLSCADAGDQKGFEAGVQALGAFTISMDEYILTEGTQIDALNSGFDAGVEQLRIDALTMDLSEQHVEALEALETRHEGQKGTWLDVIDRLAGKRGAELEQPLTSKPKASQRKPLSEVIDDYCRHKLKTQSWTAKTEQEMRTIFTTWARLVGAMAIGDYGPEEHVKYQEDLHALPPNQNKRKVTAGAGAASGAGQARIDSNTYKKHLGSVNSLLKWARAVGMTSFEPISITIAKSDKKPSESRQPFDIDDLCKLFCRDGYPSSGQDEPYKFWIALLGLFTGARINELAQLFLADFQAKGGVQVISVNDNGEGKRLKTKASERLIPIHAELVRLGLLDYVEALRHRGETRLFPELELQRDGCRRSRVLTSALVSANQTLQKG